MEKVYLITQSEKNSILYYQGATDNIILNESNEYLREFYRVPNAYEVINTLLFPGIENERTRISEEHRKLDALMLDYMPEMLKIYSEMYSAMCKYTYWYEKRKTFYLYRKDRMNTWKFLKQGQTCSFMSTSMTDKIDPSYYEKAKLLLLEITSPGGIEHLDVNDILGEDSGSPEETEILFAPFLYLGYEELEMTDEEKNIRDKNGEAPKAKFRIDMKDSAIEVKSERDWHLDSTESQKLQKNILKEDAIEIAKKVWSILEKGNMPDDGLKQKYTEWKSMLHVYLKLQYTQIKENILNSLENR